MWAENLLGEANMVQDLRRYWWLIVAIAIGIGADIWGYSLSDAPSWLLWTAGFLVIVMGQDWWSGSRTVREELGRLKSIEPPTDAEIRWLVRNTRQDLSFACSLLALILATLVYIAWKLSRTS